MVTSVTTTPEGRRLAWRFWLAWVAASVGAIGLGFVLLYLLIAAAKAIAPATNEDLLMGWAMFPVLGLLLGTIQWLVLRRSECKKWLSGA